MNSCLKYVEAAVKLYFPASEGIQCDLCPCLETYARRQCRLTGEYLAKGYLIGAWCPLEIKGDQNVGEFENL